MWLTSEASPAELTMCELHHSKAFAQSNFPQFNNYVTVKSQIPSGCTFPSQQETRRANEPCSRDANKLVLVPSFIANTEVDATSYTARCSMHMPFVCPVNWCTVHWSCFLCVRVPLFHEYTPRCLLQVHLCEAEGLPDFNGGSSFHKKQLVIVKSLWRGCGDAKR